MAASRPLRPVGESNNVISLLITGLNADVCQSEVDRFVGLVHNGHRESSARSTAEVRGNPVRRVTSEQNRSMTGASWDAGYWTFVPDRKVNARLPASNRIGPEITECRTGITVVRRPVRGRARNMVAGEGHALRRGEDIGTSALLSSARDGRLHGRADLVCRATQDS
jgi:hypothetical protein